MIHINLNRIFWTLVEHSCRMFMWLMLFHAGVQGFVVCPPEKRFLLLFTFLKKNRRKKIMVFFSSCMAVKFFNELLNYIDIPVMCIHVSWSLCMEGRKLVFTVKFMLVFFLFSFHYYTIPTLCSLFPLSHLLICLLVCLCFSVSPSVFSISISISVSLMSEHGSVYQCTHTNSVIIKTSKSEGIPMVDTLMQDNNERWMEQWDWIR